MGVIRAGDEQREVGGRSAVRTCRAGPGGYPTVGRRAAGPGTTHLRLVVFFWGHPPTACGAAVRGADWAALV